MRLIWSNKGGEKSLAMQQIAKRKLTGYDENLAEARTPRITSKEWLPVVVVVMLFAAMFVFFAVSGFAERIIERNGALPFVALSLVFAVLVHVVLLHAHVRLLNRRIDALIEVITTKKD